MELISPVIAFILNVVSQIIFSRLLKGKKLLKTELGGFVIGLISLSIIEYYIHTDTFYPAANLIIYTGLSYCYFHFINLAVTARRIRILRELHSSEDGLTEREIMERYNSKDMISNRISRMVGSGQVICKNDKFYIGKPILLLIAKTILFLKIVIIGKKSEFDS